MMKSRVPFILRICPALTSSLARFQAARRVPALGDSPKGLAASRPSVGSIARFRSTALVAGWIAAWTFGGGLLGCSQAAVEDEPAEASVVEKPEPEPSPDASDKNTAEDPMPQLENPFPRRVDAPPLDGGVAWFNTDKPIALEDLRGKFVLLDFWTYCCINCMHVLPELKKLEHAYPNELVVIGVHSAKFEEEKKSENIRDAILRHEIEHPVVNDAEMKIWDQYGVRSWPTMVLIDPTGQAFWFQGGEQTFERLDQILRLGLPYYRAKGLLDAKPMKFALERDKVEPTPLRYPGKVFADAANDRLVITDSGHNRIVIASANGDVIDIIGSGSVGAADGDFTTAQFDHPQGVALVGDLLYVADTENHAIRVADLKTKQVTTVAGTGEQARQLFTPGAKDATKVPLNSPWALWPHDGELYIAMAGPHQIWKLPLAKPNEIAPYAGNGREDIVDGPLLPPTPYETGYASFAQPSGFASDGDWLYVADTEGSSVRAVPFDPNGEVKTIVGTANLPGGRLFVFGDRDGKGPLEKTVSNVRFRGGPEQTTGPLLQHAIGIAYADGKLYIADTYNNKVKTIDPASGDCQTFAGTGEPGRADGPAGAATFDEPAGLAVLGDRLFVADTNNHVIRVINLSGDRSVSTLEFQDLMPPK